MKITIICVGKIKEKFYTEAVRNIPNGSAATVRYPLRRWRMKRQKNRQAKPKLPWSKTGKERILKSIRPDGYVIALAIDGEQPDSIELSREIEKLGLGGVSHIYFVIGGSLGLSDKVLKRADARLSFSKMTFPIS